MSAVLERNAHVHPVMAAILNAVSESPMEVARAAYVSRLARMDWQFEFGDRNAFRKGRDELQALRVLQVDLDPLAVLWNKNVPVEFQALLYSEVVITNPGEEPVTHWVRTGMPEFDLSLLIMDRNNVFGASIKVGRKGASSPEVVA